MSVSYMAFPFKRQLTIRSYYHVFRLIDEAAFNNVDDPTLVHDIVKLSINAYGWLVTMDGISSSILFENSSTRETGQKRTRLMTRPVHSQNSSTMKPC